MKCAFDLAHPFCCFHFCNIKLAAEDSSVLRMILPSVHCQVCHVGIVYPCLVKLSNRSLPLKQNVHLRRTAIKCLRQQEETADEADKGCGREIEGDLSSKVSSIRVEHVREDESLHPGHGVETHVGQSLGT